ncbi:hypothetical protein KSP39_PZI002310 [Platanthera zijinensis]|uniref:CCR4-Not complex component Not1 C-terminal domain-containing protein n=1 Tax=Platanthera zijinensis TaxID=2320716 RepID=A0AAP0C060_9ASPA
MPKLLTANSPKGWPFFQRLLVDLFKFVDPYLRNAELSESIDLLAEISQPPRILSDVEGALKSKQIKVDIDEYLMTRPEGFAFLAELKQRLLLYPNEATLAGTPYNVPLINSIVLYVGMQVKPIVDDVQSRGDAAIVDFVLLEASFINTLMGLFGFVSPVLYDALFNKSNLWLCSYTIKFHKVVLKNTVEIVSDLPDPEVS